MQITMPIKVNLDKVNFWVKLTIFEKLPASFYMLKKISLKIHGKVKFGSSFCPGPGQINFNRHTLYIDLIEILFLKNLKNT